MVPMAVASIALAPPRSRQAAEQVQPALVRGRRRIVLLSVALFWYAWLSRTRPRALAAAAQPAAGHLSSAFVWAPIANATTRNLPPRQAGAGSGVYNATRQVGSVLGSASMSALIQARLAAELPTVASGGAAAAPSSAASRCRSSCTRDSRPRWARRSCSRGGRPDRGCRGGVLGEAGGHARLDRVRARPRVSRAGARRSYRGSRSAACPPARPAGVIIE